MVDELYSKIEQLFDVPPGAELLLIGWLDANYKATEDKDAAKFYLLEDLNSDTKYTILKTVLNGAVRKH